MINSHGKLSATHADTLIINIYTAVKYFPIDRDKLFSSDMFSAPHGGPGGPGGDKQLDREAEAARSHNLELTKEQIVNINSIFPSEVDN